MLTEGKEQNVDWRNRGDWRAECWLKEQSGLGSWILTEGTELAVKRNFDWRKSSDWRSKWWLKKQIGLESWMLTEGTLRPGEKNVDWRKGVLVSGMLTEGTERIGQRNCNWRNTADWRAELTEGTERTGKRNVDWRNKADWRGKCWLKEHSVLENAMLTEGTERNTDWSYRADWTAEFWLKEQSCKSGNRKALLLILQGIVFYLLTVCTVVLMQCQHAQCCWRNQQVLRQSRSSLHFWRRIFITAFTTAHRSVSFRFMPLQLNVILPSKLKSSKWSSSSGVHTKTLCELLSSIRAICSDCLIIFYLLTPLLFPVECTHTCPLKYLQIKSVMLHSVTTVQQMTIVNSRTLLLLFTSKVFH